MPTRSALPQNYLKSTGTQLEDFETLSDWTIAGGTGEANTSQFRTGTKSLKLTATSDSGAPNATKTINQNFAGQRLFSIWVHTHTPTVGNWRIYLEFSSVSNFSKEMKATIFPDNWCIQNQWVKIIVHRDDFAVTGGELWTNQMIRMKITAASDGGCRNIISFDDFRYGEEGLPRTIISFDDGYLNDLGDGDSAYSYMIDRGLRGTIYQRQDRVGDPGNNFTLADLQALYAQGFAIANHTISHPSLGTISENLIREEIQGCTDWLIANGMPRGAYHLAYPNGSYNDTVLAVMTDLGMLTGRRADVGLCQPVPMANYHLITARLLLDTTTLAVAMSWVDQAIKEQDSLHLVFHRIVASPASSTEWPITDYKALIDYIVARKIKCVTIDEWYKGLSNPRYRSLPLTRI